MKITAKLSRATAALLILGTVGLNAGQAAAFSDGQIEGGNIYRISDLTTNSGFANPASANACDTLEYRARLYNPGGATLNNVNVQALISNEQLTSNTSTLDAGASNADPSNTYAFATVNLSSAQTLSYVAGSTQLLDQNDNPIRNLPDGITISGTGVNIGNLGPSVIEFVQFQVQVSCPPINNTSILTPIVTTKTVMQAPPPTQLVNTGPGDVAAAFLATTIVGTLAYRRWLLSRKSA